MLITKDMMIFQVLQEHPAAREVFAAHGMGCVECMGAMGETIANGARQHGLDLKALLKDLNALCVTRAPNERGDS